MSSYYCSYPSSLDYHQYDHSATTFSSALQLKKLHTDLGLPLDAFIYIPTPWLQNRFKYNNLHIGYSTHSSTPFLTRRTLRHSSSQWINQISTEFSKTLNNVKRSVSPRTRTLAPLNLSLKGNPYCNKAGKVEKKSSFKRKFPNLSIFCSSYDISSRDSQADTVASDHPSSPTTKTHHQDSHYQTKYLSSRGKYPLSPCSLAEQSRDHEESAFLVSQQEQDALQSLLSL